jgi:outer membrane protein assembly factor BamB
MSRLTAIGVLALLSAVPLVAQTSSPSWPQWRGVARDGAATFDVPGTWPQQLTRRWEVTVGEGHSSPVVAGDRIVVFTRQAEREVVAAYDLGTGKLLWLDGYAAPYTLNSAARAHGKGPKSTPAIADGRVFTLGISGVLSAHDLASGKMLWRTEAAATLPQYGTAMSPMVDGTAVIAHMGGDSAGALTAFEAATGRVRWRWTGAGPSYASPVIATLAGTRQIVTQTRNQLAGVEASSGQPLW